jgi:hypothetical protein
MHCTPGLIRPMEIVNDDERLSVLRAIIEERKVFEFFKQLLFNSVEIHPTVSRRRPRRTFKDTRVLLYSEAVILPYVYVYLNDVVFTATSRIFYFTYMDWTNQLNVVVSLTIGLYPELECSFRFGFRLPTDAELNIEQFTCMGLDSAFLREQFEGSILRFFKVLTDTLLELGALREYKVDEIRRVIRERVAKHVCVSSRLLNVVMYALRLRRHILTYIQERCVCGGWKKDVYVCKCLSLCSLISEQFPDAKQLCNDVVQFATRGRC